MLFTRLLGRVKGAILALVGIALYKLLVGAGPSCGTGCDHAWATQLARQFGRQQQELNILGFIATLMAPINPHVLWDVSFQLSFMATLGLIWDVLFPRPDCARGKKPSNWRCYNVSSVDQ